MTLKRLAASFAGRQEFPIEVDEVRDWMLAQRLQDEIHFFPVDIDAKKLKGTLYRFTTRDGVYGEPCRTTHICYAAGLNVCWRRFVCCKELMHLFDHEGERANTRELLADLTRELGEPFNPDAKQSDQWRADHLAIFKALMVLCPLEAVDRLRSLYESQQRSAYDVALFFRVPEYYVRALMSPVYVQAWKEFAG